MSRMLGLVNIGPRWYARTMAQPWLNKDRSRMRAELGFEKWEAVGHFLSDGDYLGFNCSDHRGAIAQYEKAWELLSTPWQQQEGGFEILEGIANFALLSNDTSFAAEILEGLLHRIDKNPDTSLREACDKLAHLVGKRDPN
jgi:hypothetical protein